MTIDISLFHCMSSCLTIFQTFNYLLYWVVRALNADWVKSVVYQTTGMTRN